MLETILSPRQVSEWKEFYAVEPWGEERADMRMARQVWATLQVASGKKRLDERDYMLTFEAKAPPTQEEYRERSMRAYERHVARLGAN